MAWVRPEHLQPGPPSCKVACMPDTQVHSWHLEFSKPWFTNLLALPGSQGQVACQDAELQLLQGLAGLQAQAAVVACCSHAAQVLAQLQVAPV